MTDEPTPEMIEKWHRRFAVEGNNRTWDLIDKPNRLCDFRRLFINVFNDLT